MYSKVFLSALAAAFFTSVSAQTPVGTVPASASELDLLVADQQYVNAGLNRDDQTTGFGVDLEAQAILTVSYGGTIITPGQAVPAADAGALPTIYVTPSAAHLSNFSSTNRFTLALADASALGHPDPQGNFRHYLANSVSGGAAAVAGNNATYVLSREGANVITFYAGPGPAAGEGPHRYAWLLFQQPSAFAAPEGLTASGTSPSHWSVQSYVSNSNLGPLVAAAFFTVENGQATYTVSPTSSVDPATISVSSTTGAPGTTTTGLTTAQGSSTTTTGAPQETSGNGSGAMKVMGSGAGVVLTLAGIAALAMVF